MIPCHSVGYMNNQLPAISNDVILHQFLKPIPHGWLEKLPVKTGLMPWHAHSACVRPLRYPKYASRNPMGMPIPATVTIWHQSNGKRQCKSSSVKEGNRHPRLCT